jgi:hypothetical protein
MRELKTLARGSSFSYEGSLETGLTLHFGSSNKFQLYVSKENCSQLIKQFKGKRVVIGTSRDKPPKGSLGYWLKNNVSQTAISSYMAPILIEEGYAKGIGNRELQFN